MLHRSHRHLHAGRDLIEGLVPVQSPRSTNPVSAETIRENVRRSLARKYPVLIGVNPPGDGLFSIVASGPSTLDYLDMIRSRPLVVAAGSAHTALLRNGIVPRAAIAIDPLPSMAAAYRESHPDVHYLIASQCAPAVFDALEGRRVTLWHAGTDVELRDIIPAPFNMYGGGNTVTLRALTIGLAFGYKDFEFFGFDCCLMDNKRHAVAELDSLAAQGETDLIPAIVGGRRFVTTSGLLAMAASYRDLARNWQDLFRVAIHGDGIPAWMTHRKDRVA